MRFSLFDILIATGCCAWGVALGNRFDYWFFKGNIASSNEFTLAVISYFIFGPVIYLLITPVIYRLLRLPSLLVPKCPGCRKRYGYGYDTYKWPKAVATCRRCNQKVEIWFVRPNPRDISSEMPVVYLRWPRSIGNWHLIAQDTKNEPHP